MSDISDLFAKDPLSLTSENIDAIIEKMRANRALFMAGQRTEKLKAPAGPKVPKAKVTGLDLSDLDI